ncbi:hypothetical protein BGZ94_007160, partial [Podila epigama]
MRSIRQRPGLLETIIKRPYKVECWACFHIFWLHRNGVDTPWDWTCPDCQTRQVRDKEGNLMPLPEMFDDSLNRDTTNLMTHSRLSRSGANRVNKDTNGVFCDQCNGHQRVVYQLLSNYIPGEDEEGYQRYYDSAESYRRQLEQRYPLACSKCLDKVQRVLSKQGYKLKSNVLNMALNNSVVNTIGRTRKYPSTLWIMTGISFLSANTALMITSVCGAFGSDILPRMGPFEALRLPESMDGALKLDTLARASHNLNIFGLLPWSRHFGTVFESLTDQQLGGVTLFLICLLSATSLFWDPLQFVVQRSPQKRIRTRWYYRPAYLAYVFLLAIQILSLALGLHKGFAEISYIVLACVQTATLVALFIGRTIQDPIELKFHTSHVQESNKEAGRSLAHTRSTDKVLDDDNPFLSSSPSTSRNRQAQSNPISREPSYDSHQPPTFRPSLSFTESRPGSPEEDHINWSPRKPRSQANTYLPARFGMYRDSSASDLNDNQPSDFGRPRSFQERLESRPVDYQFRARAYEASPLTNPQMLESMSLGNMSLGQMLGFPSAKFQPPENHFSHRSTSRQAQKSSDLWSYRRGSTSDQEDSRRLTRRPHSRFPGNAGSDLEDDDEDVHKDRFGKYASTTDHDMFSRFGSMGTQGSRGEFTADRREAFAKQTYFPPEPETGLEDNFLGVVKIVDDYFPPNPTPRTIAGRNLMMKKRKVLLWIALVVLCRVVPFIKTKVDAQVWSIIQWPVKILFVCTILHATSFWIVTEYQMLQNRPSTKKSADKKQTPHDPFEPTTTDKMFSYALLVVLVSRLAGIVLTIVTMVMSLSTRREQDRCPPQNDWVLHLSPDAECIHQERAMEGIDIMDWIPWSSETPLQGRHE